MQYLKWAAGGALGAAIGAAVWLAAGSLLNAHLGILIVLVGVLAGLGVRRMARDGDSRFWPAAVAIFFTLAVGALTKYGVTMANHVPKHQQFWDSTAGNSIDDEAMIGTLADEIVLERQARNETINWPDPDMTYADATFEDDYPADLWAEGKQRWEALSPDEQAERRNDRREQVDAVIHQQRAPERHSAFRASLGSWDIVWFSAALIGAFWFAGRFDE
jgi:hypothetical protein